MQKAAMLAVVAALATALAAAGCGGDDDETTTQALSKQEFIAQADQICKKGDKQIDKEAAKVFEQGQRPSSQEQEQFFTDTVIPGIQSQIDGVRALTPPEGDEEQVTAFLDSAQEDLDRVEQDPSAFTQRQEDPFAETSKLAKQYGFQRCAD